MRALFVFGFILATVIGAHGFLNTFEIEKEIQRKLGLLTVEEQPNTRAYEEKWVTQRLDNFNIQNQETWENRYYENDEFYEPDGPIFIFVTGFNAVRELWLRDGLMYDIANDTNGLLIASEHRFYGESRPTENLSIENMRFLNHGQAILDIATLISHIKQDPDLEDAPVVLVGQLYGAAIASWFRKRFPHLVAGVWASSPRVEARADVHEYLTQVANDIQIYGSLNCSERIQNGFQEIEEIITGDDNDASELTDIFRLCQDIDTEDPWDVAAFAHTIAIAFGLYVDYGGERAINDMCEIIEDEDEDSDVQVVANFITYAFSFQLVQNECLNFNYEYMSNFLREQDWDVMASISGAHQWTYQLCTEFGWFRTSTEENQPFSNLFPVEIFYDMCGDVFGDFITRDFLDNNIDRININNGGSSPRVSNIIYTIGSLDPWRSVAVDEQVEGSDVYVLPGETTSADLESISEDDSLELFRVKRAIRRTILEWVSPDRDPVEERWVTQQLNHYNLQDDRTWEQRYIANGRYFEIGGPIFIFVGGQWQLDRLWLEQGLLYDIARESNGYLVATEHRYYGESRPTEDLSPDNLRFLTHEQAIGDLSNIIFQLTQDREFRTSKIILVSSGYGASIATWFASRYPHLIEGIWASSARLEARFDFSNYFESVAEDISEVGGENCLERIVDGFEDLETLIQGNHPDIADLDELFDLCQNIDPDDIYSVSSFLHGLELLFSIFIEVGGEVAINDICNIMEDPRNPDPIAALADFVNYMYPRAECINIKYGALIDAYADHDWDGYGAISGGRQWIYQRCTEFAWFRSSPQSFTESVALEHFVTACDALFGDFFSEESINEAVDRINLLNGGVTPNVRNAIFTNGAVDPWISVGVTDDIEGSHVFIIPGESQSADLSSISPYDSDELREIKEQIFDILVEWAAEEIGPRKD